MPVALPVRRVREAIYREAGHAESSVARMKPELGGVFYRGVSALLWHESPENCAALLENEDSSEARSKALARALYQNALGPYLSRNAHALAPQTQDLLNLWEAMREFARWLIKTFAKHAQDIGWQRVLETMLIVEQPASLEMRDPAWTDSVTLGGIPDLVVRSPGDKPHWCVVEFKLGYTSPEADLAQACLYRRLLAGQTEDAGAIALVSFEPALKERFYSAEKLKTVEQKLLRLIGREAGVLPDAPPPVRPVSQGEQTLEAEILRVFAEFHAPAERAAEPITGSAFIRFCVTPARGVKAKAVLALGNELRVRLQLSESPIFTVGSGGITVDVQRPVRELVPFEPVESQFTAQASGQGGSSQLPVGVDLANKLVLADLAEPKHTHILVIGTTGSGKSEWLRAATAGLMLGNTPQTLRFVLIDPKRTAFNEMERSPFLLHGRVVYPNDEPVLKIFEALVEEMEDRYRLLQSRGVDDLRALIAAGETRPRIVCVCDEYANLLQGISKPERQELERQFSRLGAKARAAGIHLILATQEARRETIRGSIDANLPARVALRVQKELESRLVLGEGGAEKLLGQGDLLFKDVGAPVRLQGLYLSKARRAEIFGGAV